MTFDKNKKICVLHLIGSTGLYGAERWVLALMRASNADKVNMTLINLVDSGCAQSQVVTAAKQRGFVAFDFVTGGKFNPIVAVRLAKWIREHQINIVHGHGFKSDVIGLLSARLSGVKMITTPHGWSQEGNNKLKLYETIDRWLFKYMDIVCPLSCDLAKGISTGNKIRLIQNGVDVEEVLTAISSDKTNINCYLIGYIGQLIERKDLNTLFAAFKILYADNKNIRLMVIGDGHQKDALQARAKQLGIENQVEFLGYRQDATSLLKTFDVFVLPSLMEGIPRCIMEAMAAGIPVIVSDIPGNRDLVVLGKTGLLFAPGNSQDLAEKIEYARVHPDDAKRMAIRASDMIMSEYSSRKMALEYETIYYELMSV
ncbi:glycosyltransferase [Geobacter sp. AOG2]|uniref:glycosyltransferase n=1 Tax=Geobacter sp. AOG2 TaxID=1566347 RepID=UPI001CC80B49|nr:glycosyltransferase [Geobacter sp. AOG2]